MTVPPEAPSLRPRDLPRLRDSLVEWYQGRVAPDMLAIEVAEGRLLSELNDPRRIASAVGEADLYHVSARMSELVETAARSLPEFTLTAEDPPSQLGLAWFERPIPDRWEAVHPSDGRTMPIAVHAATWQTVDPRVLVTIWVARDRISFPVDHPPDPSWRSLFPVVVPIGHAVMPLGPTGLGPGESGHVALAAVKTMWLLLRQPLAEMTTLAPDRAARRQAARQGREASIVRVVTLRRPAGAATGTGRDWHHQWMVRGHWRMQAHGPGRQQHRPVWIAPHVKGPEGAPMLGGEKVYAWTK